MSLKDGKNHKSSFTARHFLKGDLIVMYSTFPIECTVPLSALKEIELGDGIRLQNC